MGVAVLQAYPLPPDRTVPQVIEVLQKRICNLGATPTGQFLVDCETYYSTPTLAGPPRTLNVLHNSEQPATVFSVIEPASNSAPGSGQPQNPNKPNVTFTCDTLFDLLLLKLGNVYAKKFKIESKGSRFEIGDFLVKLGIVSTAGSFKGILVEVEYLPCVVFQNCWGLIFEFMQGFLGSVVTNQIPPYIVKKQQSKPTGPGQPHPELYTPVDTIQQYLEHFAAFRKNAPVGNAGGGPPRSDQQQANRPLPGQ